MFEPKQFLGLLFLTAVALSNLVGAQGGTAPTPIKPPEPTTPAGSGSGQQTPPGEPSKPAEKPVEVLVSTVESILKDLISGKASEADRGSLEKRLVEALSAEERGNEATRRAESVYAIGEIMAQMRQAQTKAANTDPNTPLALAAAKALAMDISRNIERRMPRKGVAPGSHAALPNEPALPKDYLRAEWLTLGGWPYKERMKLPEQVTQFHGKKVGVTGYMIALDEVEDIHEFLLVESLWSCCFGSVPEVHQVVVVRYKKKPGVELITTPIQILGTMEVGEEVEDGFVTSVYRLNAEKVIEISLR